MRTSPTASAGSAIAFVLALWPIVVSAQAIVPIDDAKLPRFEVASVKPGDPNSDFGRIGLPPGRFSQQNLPLATAILWAFDIKPYQLAMPLPDLVTRERFMIEARVPEGAAATDRALMIRALLIDRFRLRYHVDHHEEDGYTLTVARRDGRLGPALHASPVDCQSRLAAQVRNETLPPLPAGAAECGVRNGPGSINFGGMPIAALASMLSNQTGKPVSDKTGLAGNFDVQLRFSLQSAGPPRTGDVAPTLPDDAPSIYSAVQEQLGLKLTPSKATVDRLVIDHIERPDPD
jgi:uncharacterized protein (TIGR03435 family)